MDLKEKYDIIIKVIKKEYGYELSNPWIKPELIGYYDEGMLCSANCLEFNHTLFLRGEEIESPSKIICINNTNAFDKWLERFKKSGIKKVLIVKMNQEEII